MSGIDIVKPTDLKKVSADAEMAKAKEAMAHLSAAATLGEIADDLAGHGIEFAVADMHHRPRALLHRAGFLDRIGRGLVFDKLEQAVAALADVGTAEPAGAPRTGTGS